jgi:pimeloyl-ACP methyl ester carboxylesterase
MGKRFAAGSSWEREKAVSRSMLYKTPAGESVVMAIYDAALQSWPVPCQTQMVSTRYGETFVIASGNPLAPPIILLHGAGGNSAMWAGDVEGYSSQFRVYAVDLPGEAGKSTSNRPTWDSPAFAEWLEDVLNGLRIKHVTFVGISQGAWAALKFAVVNPERVRKLALIAPAGIIPDRLSFLPTAIVLSLFGKWGIKRLVGRLLADQNPPESVIETVGRNNGSLQTANWRAAPLYRRRTTPSDHAYLATRRDKRYMS